MPYPKIILSLIVSFIVAMAASAGFAQDMTIEHMQGETTVVTNPETVFSYDFASIDTLQALGVEVDGMPPLSFAGSERYAGNGDLAIGSLFEPDFEAVNAAQPDLVIVAARSAAAYGDLSGIAPTIDLTFAGQDMLSELTSNVMTLASIFTKDAEAEAELASIEATIEALKPAVSEGGTGFTVIVSGGSVSILAAENARGGRGALLHQVLGLESAFDDIESAVHGEPVSFEFLLEHNPDWLFVIDRDAAIGAEGAQPAAQVLDNDIMKETKAMQNNQIVYLNPFDWYIITGAGLGTMQTMLAEVAAAYDVPLE